MGFSAVAAVFAGTADAATVLTAVAEVGTAVSAVGAVTGNKTMMEVGGAMGIVGGVGGLVAGSFGAGADAIASTGGLGDAGAISQSGGMDAVVANSGGDTAGLVGSAGDVGQSAAMNVTQNQSSPIVGQTIPGSDFTGSASPSNLIGNTNGLSDLGNSNPALDAQAPNVTAANNPSSQNIITTPSADTSNTISSGTQSSTNAVTTPSNQPYSALDGSTGDAGAQSQAAQMNQVATANGATAAPKGQNAQTGFFGNLFNTPQGAAALTQTAGGLVQGIGMAYNQQQALQLQQAQLALKQQQQSWGNQVPTVNYNSPGIIASRRLPNGAIATGGKT